MQSEFQNNQNYNQFISKDVFGVDVLTNFLLSAGESIDYSTFNKIINEQDNKLCTRTALKFNNQIREITDEEYKRIASPITARITKVYSDGYIDVQKPTDGDENCWSRIPNFTIFKYLEVGDEVVLGCYNGAQKSNCWVMFAKLTCEEFKKKTIYRDIEKLKTIHNNTKILEKWLKYLELGGD